MKKLIAIKNKLKEINQELIDLEKNFDKDSFKMITQSFNRTSTSAIAQIINDKSKTILSKEEALIYMQAREINKTIEEISKRILKLKNEKQ